MKKLKHLMLFENYTILGRLETVRVSNKEGHSVERQAKIDTATKSSRISNEIAAELRLPIIDTKKVWNELGEEERKFVEVQFNINGIEIVTKAGVTDMSDLSVDVIIGYQDIKMVNGIIDINKEETPIDEPIENTIKGEIVEEIPEETEDLEYVPVRQTGIYIEGEIENKEE